MSTKTVFGRDRKGNPAAATVTVVNDTAPPLGRAVPFFRLEVRGDTFLSQHMFGRTYKTLWRVYADGQEERVA